MYDNNQNINIYPKLQEAHQRIINGNPLYEKDIDRIVNLAVEKVLKKLSVSVDTTKAVMDIKELNQAIQNLGGK